MVEVGFHSFRHSWVTEALENGVDSATVHAIAGWGSPAMEKVYSHVSPEHMEQVLGVNRAPSGATIQRLSDEQLRLLSDTVCAELRNRRLIPSESNADDSTADKPVAIPA